MKKRIFLFLIILFSFLLISCKEEYEINVSSSDLDITLEVGETEELTITYTEGTRLLLNILDDSIIKIDKFEVSGLAIGQTSIVLSLEGKNIEKTIKVTVVAPSPKDITISGAKDLVVGEEITLTALVTPTKASQEVTWTSSDKSVISIEGNGLVKALKNGKVTIVATSKIDANIKAEVEITVSSSVVNPDSITILGVKTIKVGESTTYKATVEPNEAEKTVVWSVSNPELASITDGGVLTALSAGKLKVIATSTVNEIFCELEVEIQKDEIKPSKITIVGPTEVSVGESANYTIDVTPSDANKDVVWKFTDDTDIATITNGKLVTLSQGVVTIVVQSTMDEGIYGILKVTITMPKPTSVFIDGPGKIIVGESGQFSVFVEPEGTSADVVWSVNDESIATIDQNGLLKAIKVGEVNVKIVSKVDNTLVDQYTVIISPILSESIAIDGPSEIVVGEGYTYTVAVLPASASQKVNWVVEPMSTARINNGVLKVTAPGEYKLLAQTTDGSGKLDSIMITAVSPAVENLTIKGLATTVINSNEQYSVDFLPLYAQGEVNWTVDDKDFASISDKGLFKATEVGEYEITVSLKSNPSISATFTVTVIDALSEIAVSSNYSKLENGAAVIVEGKEFVVGTSAFSSLGNANGKLMDGTTIYLGAGTYDSDLTIDYSNVSIIGPNHKVDARKERFLEAIITGDILINSGVNNTTISGIELTDNAQIIGNSNGNIDGVLFQYNYIYSSSVDAGSGIFYFKSNADTAIFSNLKVSYCFFECPSKFGRLIRCSNTRNLTIEHSDLIGGYDALYLSGTNETATSGPGIHGEFIIDDITVTGVQQFNIFATRYDFSLFRMVNSKFFDEGGDAYGGIIDARTFNDTVDKVKIEILYNEFIDCFDWHLFRFTPNQRTIDTFSVEFNYNLITVPNVSTYAIVALKQSNEKMIDAQYNYYENWTPTEDNYSLTTNSIKYNALISMENAFESEEALKSSIIYSKLDNTGDDTLIVGESTLLKKKTLYEDLTSALAAATDGSTIVLLPGNYDDNVTIDKNNITLKTLNAELNPNMELSRYDEVNYSGVIKLAKNVEKTTIKGFVFNQNAQILNTMGDAGTAANIKTNINGFTFQNNVVETSLIGSKGFIYFIENESCGYSKDLNISFNKFSCTSDSTVEAVVYIDNNIGLVAKGNHFMEIVNNAFYIHDSTRGAAGDVSITENMFYDIGGTALRINWLTPYIDVDGRSLININANIFTDVGKSGVYLGCMNNTCTLTALNIQYNSFTNVNQPIHLDRVMANSNTHVNYNKFNDIPTGEYFYNDSIAKSTASPVPLDATNNLYMNNGEVIVFDSTKVFGEVTTSPYYDDESKLPIYSSDGSIYITEINFKQINGSLFVGDVYQTELEYKPITANSLNVLYSSSDESIVTIDRKGVITCHKIGSAYILVIYSENSLIRNQLDIEVTEYTNVEMSFEGTGVLKVNDELQISSEVLPVNSDVVYSSSDESIATISATGLVKALKEGVVVITSKSKNNESVAATLTIVVKNTADDPVQFILDANIGNALARNIKTNANASNFKTEMTFGAVSKVWFGDVNIIEKEFFPINASDNGNRPGTKLYSTEFIVVHDTGNNSLGGTALAHYNYAKTTNVSWHYTVDDECVIHQFPDDEMAYHAGDGLRAFGLNDTSVKAIGENPTLTITDDGYYAFNGIKSIVVAPLIKGQIAKTSNITPSGIYVEIGLNGNYFINNTYYNSDYNKICNQGGGANGIGIESCVDEGSDLYTTWQRLAKLVAKLLVDNDLDFSRVMQHNNFSGKDCPMTLRAASLWDDFMEMVEFEYRLITEFKDYTFEFTSNNPNIVDNTGKVINPPKVTTVVSYTVKITNNQGFNESVTLYSRIPGIKTIK